MRVLLLLLLLSASAARAETLVYFGTYTSGSSEGIYVSEMDEATGALTKPRLAAQLTNPSFVALHPTGKFLYAVSEVGAAGPDSNGLTAYQIKEDGTLAKLNHRSTRGGAACHVSVDPEGRCVAAANYTGGSCILYKILDDGSLGEEASFHQHTGGSGVNPRRQSSPHAHSVNFNGDATQAFVADLGLDQVLMYDVDPDAATMKPSAQPHLALAPGGGPRHFSLDPKTGVAFSNLEMTSQVTMLSYDAAKKSLSAGVTLSTLPDGWEGKGNSTAECLIHPKKPWLYVSNRGHNSIAAFRFDAAAGKLERIENESTQGDVPRGFGIDPAGKFLVAGNQQSDNVVVLRIEADGSLSPTGHGVTIGNPVNVRFLVR